MRFLDVRLAAAARRIDEQRRFYGERLGLPVQPRPDGVAVTVGETGVTFVASQGEPFYHFAFLLPGDRFDAALAWARERVTLLPHGNRPEVVFDFPAWNARACYFHDPAGNIVELIAHHDRERNGGRGPFRAAEIIGLSELGLPGRPTAMAPVLAEQAGLEVWDGVVADRDALAFVGSPARTFILVPTGRGWLPTGRPAEPHPVQALVSGDGEQPAEVELDTGPYRIRRGARG